MECNLNATFQYILGHLPLFAPRSFLNKRRMASHDRPVPIRRPQCIVLRRFLSQLFSCHSGRVDIENYSAESAGAASLSSGASEKRLPFPARPFPLQSLALRSCFSEPASKGFSQQTVPSCSNERQPSYIDSVSLFVAVLRTELAFLSMVAGSSFLTWLAYAASNTRTALLSLALSRSFSPGILWGVSLGKCVLFALPFVRTRVSLFLYISLERFASYLLTFYLILSAQPFSCPDQALVFFFSADCPLLTPRLSLLRLPYFFSFFCHPVAQFPFFN